MQPIYEALKEKALQTWKEHSLLNDTVHVKARPLTPTEAIGNPEADDFPIQKGKERLMQAEIDGARGQAFTDQYGDYRGTLREITEMPLYSNYRRAIFTAALNAGLRKLGLITGSVHCRDDGPRQCAQALDEHIRSRYGNVKITQIGFQPRMVETLAAHFEMRVLDMDKDNIDSKKYGVVVESPDVTKEAVAWGDLLLVTGTTLVNGTLPDFVGDTPVLFYGTTIAGAAHLMGWERFCACSS